MTSPILAATLGTCRLADPLRWLAKNYPLDVKRLNDGVYGYVHSAPEVIQQIDYLDGHSVPAEFAPYLASDGKLPAIKRKIKPHVWLVELSSLKKLLLKSTYLQLNFFNRRFSSVPDILKLFWEDPQPIDMSRRVERMVSHPDFDKLDVFDRFALLQTEVSGTDIDDLEQAMVLIAQRLEKDGAKVVFLPHINVPNAYGQHIPARVTLYHYLLDITERHKLNFCDPTAWVSFFGSTQALASEGTDLNHYSEVFVPKLGVILLEYILRPAANGHLVRITNGQMFFDHQVHADIVLPKTRDAQVGATSEPILTQDLRRSALTAEKSRRWLEAARLWSMVNVTQTGPYDPYRVIRMALKVDDFIAAIAVAKLVSDALPLSDEATAVMEWTCRQIMAEAEVAVQSSRGHLAVELVELIPAEFRREKAAARIKKLAKTQITALHKKVLQC